MLRVSHLHYGMIVKKSMDFVATSFIADETANGKNKLSDKVVLFDEMMPIQIMSGFPNLIGVPAQLLPVFLCSLMDQQSMLPYLDAIENYGMPADVCPLPSSEAGCAVEGDYPIFGRCFVTSSMPCDGSVMSSSYLDRYFKMPTFPLALPVRYNETGDVEEYGAEEIKACIKFIEDNTGEKFDWDAYFAAQKRCNVATEMELQKWEINKTPYPQITGSTLGLYRIYYYEIVGGMDKRFTETDEQVNKLMMKAYERKEKVSAEMRHRAVVWSCPSHYYSNFSAWAENCWGINVVIDMESMVSIKIFSEDDKEEAYKDMAHCYERMAMRKHTNGGYANVLDELWRVCEEFKADMVIMYSHIACKTMAGLTGLFDEQARQRGIHLIWVEHDLMDPRTASRRDMRGKVNQYMRTIMREEPVDPSLVDFEDEKTW
jgi:benzoyl-CoA reductase/2-hydroxyglutaryl-CoA dehydratase subunit BcrC/BadD/HgdB